MPGPVRRVLVVAAGEGLILHQPGQRTERTLQITYATHEISSLGPSNLPNFSESAETHGIVGILSIAPVSYLIVILRREEVAQIRESPIYVVTNVALIPLSSQFEARKALEQAEGDLKSGPSRQATSAADNDTSDDEGIQIENGRAKDDDNISATSSESKENRPEERPGGPGRSTSNVAEDVIGRKGQYGRFAERWFSKKGWSTDKRRAQGMSTDNAEKPQPENPQWERLQKSQSGPEVLGSSPSAAESGQSVKAEKAKQLEQRVQPENTTDVANALLPKLLRTTRMLLVSRSFFFSYDFDITRRLGSGIKTSSELPLHKSVDPLFFWNRHLSLPLIEGGHFTFVLPLMQGFVGQRPFTIYEEARDTSNDVSNGQQDNFAVEKRAESNSDFLMTLISRRSVKRPGLRYLRRGVDDEGSTANTVETEQILSKATWPPSEKVYSFTQIRGSIPLFFSQSPYSFKPVPVLQHSLETNRRAFKRHFSDLVGKYGDIQIALLVDKKGGEAEIGRKYEEITNALGSIAGKEIGFEWFDFHSICRGMKFENVSLLMESLGSKLDEFGETVEVGSAIQKRQSGILRTNCMDCLDRTNVVQSACGQRALEKQLEEEGFEVDLLTDTTTRWFNFLWAENGDQISKEYSSTAALKGDYTRTRQRNYRGAINDLGLTLSRYFNNIVNDYFSQAAIDYLLGSVSAQVFDEFEATLGNRDPAISMAKVRLNAIETSSKIVIADQSEELVGGWTLMSPREPNTVRTFPFDECVLLITDVALYRVKFDWDVEKVASFERVDLRSIIGILRGTYITSILTASQTNADRNVGFVIKFKPGKEDVARVNTRSLSSTVCLDSNDSRDAKGVVEPSDKEETRGLKVLAFKALPARDGFTSMEGHESQGMSEQEVVNNVCKEIQRAAHGEQGGSMIFLEDRDIISLQEARKSTGLLEQWSHTLKKMVWA